MNGITEDLQVVPDITTEQENINKKSTKSESSNSSNNSPSFVNQIKFSPKEAHLLSVIRDSTRTNSQV